MNPLPQSILVIRRDNIGDLLCTTPLLRILRTRFPAARVTALVNSYNAPALQGNPDLDEILVYEKAKHRKKEDSFWRWLRGRLRVMTALRFADFDLVLLATPGFSSSSYKFARLTKAGRIVGYELPEPGGRFVSVRNSAEEMHEVQAVCRLLPAIDLDDAPGKMSLTPNPRFLQQLAATLPVQDAAAGRTLGLHISARKPAQRWAVERFAELARGLLARGAARILIFWAPGAEDDPLHPGDDGKAASLQAMLPGLPVGFVKTARLEELIAGLSLCDRVICADGGAMHIAAALQKPLVCLFGNSDARRWYPWGVPHVLLQKPSRDVIDISVAEVLQAEADLSRQLDCQGA